MTALEEKPEDKPDRIEEDAIAWLVRMRGEKADDLRPAFAQWLTASPLHKAVYDRASTLFDSAAQLKQSLRHGPGRPRNRPMVRYVLAGALTAAAAGLALAVLHRPGLLVAPAQTAAATPLTTRHGEIRTVRLADGTVATLDSDSRLATSFDGGVRRVALQQGKVRLVVAHANRPLEVAVAGGTVLADGASLDLALDADQVMVRLLHGAARTRPMLHNAAYAVPARYLRAGQAYCYRPADFAEIAAPSPWRDLDDGHWPTGWVAYRTVSLEVLVAQANRYAAEPIVLDGAVGAYQASGRFHLTDTGAFVARITEVFDLAVERRADGIHLTPK